MRGKGFTLAEVLITLGIIGIIAALTIPNVTAHYRKKAVEAKLKKFYTTINQAVKLSEAQNGEAEYWEVPDMTSNDATETWYKKYLEGYIKSTDIKRNVNDCIVWITLPDSSGFGIRFSTIEGSNFDVYFYPNSKIDMKNGINCGKDYFTFNYIPGKGFLPYGFSNYKKLSRNDLINSCFNTLNSCTTLLMLDNWEIKDDYPHKI